MRKEPKNSDDLRKPDMEGLGAVYRFLISSTKV